MIARTLFAACVAILAGLGVALAAAQTDQSPTQHAPRAHRGGGHGGRHAQPDNPPPADATRLMAFRGVWNFDGTVTMGSDAPRKLRWRMGCTTTAGGWALACDDTIHLPKTPVVHEHDLFAADNGAVRFYMADNMGETRELHGKWSSDQAIHYHYEGTEHGKRVVEDADVTLRDATTFDLNDTVSVDGQTQMAVKGTFHQAPKRGRRARNADDNSDDNTRETTQQNQ